RRAHRARFHPRLRDRRSRAARQPPRGAVRPEAGDAAGARSRLMAQAYRSILVAYDGSPNADRALDHAIALARDEHARLTLVAVVPPAAGVSPFAPVPGGQASWIREGFESSLRSAVARVPDDRSEE